jgi:hypothetical protein
MNARIKSQRIWTSQKPHAPYLFRQSQPGDAANGWQPRFLTFHEIPPSTRSHAPPRQPSLILFSLDLNAARDITLATQPIIHCNGDMKPLLVTIVILLAILVAVVLYVLSKTNMGTG